MMFGRSDWRGGLSPAQFDAAGGGPGRRSRWWSSRSIFFRLWYLEVLSGDRYLAEAKNNQVREITVQAPRGEIVDRNGKVLVDNRTALALQVRTDELPGPDASSRRGARSPRRGRPG